MTNFDLVVAVDALTALMALLRFKAQGGDGPRIQTFHADWFAGFLAITIASIFDTSKRRVDFSDQLALPVSRAQFDPTVGLITGAIGDIRVLFRVLEVIKSLLAFPKDLFSPIQKLFSKVSALALIHKWLVFRRPVTRRQIGAAHVAPFSRSRLFPPLEGPRKTGKAHNRGDCSPYDPQRFSSQEA
jgi:hypothetical protein